MRVVTIREPHISRIYNGEKTLEIRQSPHPWLGAVGETIALHGSKSPDGLCAGLIVATVLIRAVRQFMPCDEHAACVPWRPGLYALELEGVTPLDWPIHARGQLGLWRTVAI